MTRNFKIYCDEAIGFLDLFRPLGTLVPFAAVDLCSELIRDADILLVRSVSRVDESILKNSLVKFVGSATAGIDHIDLDYLARRNIEFASGLGGNARAVVEYVIGVLLYWHHIKKIKLPDIKVGIVGVGQVGGRLADMLTQLGVLVRCNDPILAETDRSRKYESIDALMDCDVITLHTPLTYDGVYPTYHLFDEVPLAKMKRGSLLINTSRGGVVNETALISALQQKSLAGAVIDTWADEPNISLSLFQLVDGATPHIAGYTQLARVRLAEALFKALSRFLKCEASFAAPVQQKADYVLNFGALRGFDAVASCPQLWPLHDTESLKDYFFERGVLADAFLSMRKQYPHRLEFSQMRLDGSDLDDDSRRILSVLGFRN